MRLTNVRWIGCYQEARTDTIPEISHAVRRFLASHIGSVWHLELLLLFKNSNRPLSAAEASKALYLSADVLRPAIYRFRDSGMLTASTEHPDKFRYAPKSEAMKNIIDELERSYSQQRVTVINLIFSGSIQTFADAFKLRTEDGK